MPLDPKALQESEPEVSESSSSEDENDNREIYDTNKAQKLGAEDISKLKSEGAPIENLIEKLKENSETFNKKTVFAQEKYIKKKKNKHMFYFCIKKVTLEALVQAHYDDGPMKIK